MKKSITVPVNKRVPTDDGLGYKLVPDGRLIGDVVLSFDIEKALDYMGRKAIVAKSKRCQDGFLMVTAHNVRKVPA